MTDRSPSEILFNEIDEDFPVAGQDNDSQGFRDNFSVIRNALATAKSELSTLRATAAILDSEESNNFNGGYITNVKLRNAYRLSRSTTDGGVEEVAVDVVNEQGDYFKISKTVSGKINVKWPTDNEENYIKIRLEVTNANEVDPITVAFLSNPGTEGDLKANFNNSLSPLTGITLNPGSIGIFDCWIAGLNSTMFVQHIETFE